MAEYNYGPVLKRIADALDKLVELRRPAGTQQSQTQVASQPVYQSPPRFTVGLSGLAIDSIPQTP